jgi:DNA-binding response OmpR family regulator
MGYESISAIHLDDNIVALRQMKKAIKDYSSSVKIQLESFQKADDYRKRIQDGPVPDLVLLDIHLDNSDTDGVALTSETRKLHPHSIILLCSSANDAKTVTDCLQAGADDFISKTADSAELSSHIQCSYRLVLRQISFSV